MAIANNVIRSPVRDVVRSPLGDYDSGGTQPSLGTVTIYGESFQTGYGTLPWYISLSSTPPNAIDLQAGTGAVDFGTVEVGPLPTAVNGNVALAPSTNYWFHYIDPADDSIGSVNFTTPAADTTAPIISNATLTVINESTLSAGFDTDEGNGEFHWVLTTGFATPSIQRIKDGQDSLGAPATASNTQAVSDVGTQAVFGNISGLSQTPYFFHVVHTDAAGNDSNVLTQGPAGPADVTAPIASSVEIVATAATTADVTFNTDTAEGTAYTVVQLSTDPAPNTTTVKAGQSLPISSSGPHTFNITGLTETTTYLAYVVHTDVAGNDSPVEVASASATTPSASVFFEQYEDGLSAGTALVRVTATDNQADNDAGTDAVLFSNDGGGNSQSWVQNNLTYNDGQNFLHFRVKAETWPAATDAWLRIRTANSSVTGIVSVNITDDATPDGSRASSATNWTNTTVTSEGNGWFTVTSEIDYTGAADRAGALQIHFAESNGSQNIDNTVADTHQLALHDLRLSSS